MESLKPGQPFLPSPRMQWVNRILVGSIKKQTLMLPRWVLS